MAAGDQSELLRSARDTLSRLGNINHAMTGRGSIDQLYNQQSNNVTSEQELASAEEQSHQTPTDTNQGSVPHQGSTRSIEISTVLAHKLQECVRLSTKYSNPQLQFLLRTSPKKQDNLSALKETLESGLAFRKYAHVFGDSEKRKLWQNFIRDLISGEPYELTTGMILRTIEEGSSFYDFRLSVTPAQLDRLDVFILECKTRLAELETAEEDRECTSEIVEHLQARFSAENLDISLATQIANAIDNTSSSTGYVYFKCWSLADGTCWYKIGITSDPNRRDAEQNVLPVAPLTICCLDLGSMQRARAVETALHSTLVSQRILHANNRELFALTDEQASAVRASLEGLTAGS